MRKELGEGYTLVELVISLVIITVVGLGLMQLFISLVQSANLAKQRSVANSLANNQMEFLRSLSYDSLAVSGGSIIASSYLPAEETKEVNGIKYTVVTTIRYADDAYDGCGSYPNIELKKKYCRNFSAPGNSDGKNLVNDTNPADYKATNVTIKSSAGVRLASVDSHMAARVSETASTTGALFITVTDPSGMPITEAEVVVKNNSLSPNVDVASLTDSAGTAIFYNLPPDINANYTINVSKPEYSSIYTIAPSGSLQPTYSKQKIITQQSSYLSLVIGKMSQNSLLIETVDTNGNPLPNVKVYTKGGYKKYTDSNNSAYYFDTLSPSDTRPVTDSSGLATLDNLPPINEYIFCNEDGSYGCVSTGGTTYYLVSAVPYGGNNSLAPITIPAKGDDTSGTFQHNGIGYSQKVRLILTTNSGFPRVFKIDPDSVSRTNDNMKNVKMVLTGQNLLGANVELVQGGTTIPNKNCSGNDGKQLTCGFDISATSNDPLQVRIQKGGFTITLPANPKGSLYVTP